MPPRKRPLLGAVLLLLPSLLLLGGLVGAQAEPTDYDFLHCDPGSRYLDLARLFQSRVARVSFLSHEAPAGLCVWSASEDDWTSLRRKVIDSIVSPFFMKSSSSSKGSNQQSSTLEDRLLTAETNETGGGERSLVGSGVRSVLGFLGFHLDGNNSEGGKLTQCDPTSGVCTLHFSPFAKACVRACRWRESKIQVEFAHESSEMAWSWTLLGAFLLVAAPEISKRPIFFYGAGSLIGVVLAVGLLALLVTRVFSSREGGFRAAHFGFAALVQALAFSARRFLVDSIHAYAEWLVVYLLLATLVSLATVHFAIKQSDGRARVSPALVDVAEVFVSLAGVCFVASGFSSPRYGVTTASILLTGLITRWACGLDVLKLLLEAVATETDDAPDASSNRFQTPKRNGGLAFAPRSATTRYPTPVSGVRHITEEEYAANGRRTTKIELERLVQSPNFAKWLRDSATRIQIDPTGLEDVSSSSSEDEEHEYEEEDE